MNGALHRRESGPILPERREKVAGALKAKGGRGGECMYRVIIRLGAARLRMYRWTPQAEGPPLRMYRCNAPQ